MECSDFPEVGTRLTYGVGLLPAVGLHDLL